LTFDPKNIFKAQLTCFNNTGKVIFNVKKDRGQVIPNKIKDLIDEELAKNVKNMRQRNNSVLENIYRIETCPKNSNKKKNYKAVVNSVAKYLTELGKYEINVGILSMGDGRFELEIIYKFYEDPKNTGKILNLFIYEGFRHREREEQIVSILDRISPSIKTRFIYFDIERRSYRAFEVKLPSIDCIIGLQTGIDPHESASRVRAFLDKFKIVYYTRMFATMPAVFIYFRAKTDELVNVLPTYLFGYFTDDFKLELLKNDYYFDLITKTILIDSMGIYNTSSPDYRPALEFILSVRGELSEEKQEKIDELVSSLKHK
jgi:hypothetical protein